MAENKNETKAPIKTPQAPRYDKDQFLQSPLYHVGHKAFIMGMDEKDFPMTIEEVDKKLGVTR